MICDKNVCTGCGACFSICPKKCIVLKVNQVGKFSPEINFSDCISCGLCVQVCPNNIEMNESLPSHVFAAYSLNPRIYNEAASGGMASLMYLLGLSQQWFMMAAKFSRSGVYFDEIKCKEDILWASNSKYVFSNMLTNNVYIRYFKALKENKICLFIGLPCQIAALLSFIKIRGNELLNRLYCVDIICHGTPPWVYLDEHLTYIEKKRIQGSIDTVKFRSKQDGYVIRCLYKNDVVYTKSMLGNETYGFGFLSNLTFNENCYFCKYAQEKRIADMTLGDFDGLGQKYVYSHENKTVSVLMVHTTKGQDLLNYLRPTEELYIEPRPLDEPYLSLENKQLHHPSIPHKKRQNFIKNYIKYHDFERAVRKSLGFELYSHYIGFSQNIHRIKIFLSKILKRISPNFFCFLKKILKGK